MADRRTRFPYYNFDRIPMVTNDPYHYGEDKPVPVADLGAGVETAGVTTGGVITDIEVSIRDHRSYEPRTHEPRLHEPRTMNTDRSHGESHDG